MRIIIKASDVAAVLGLNKFKPTNEVFDDLWKKYSPENFNSKTKLDEAKESLAKSASAQAVLAAAVSHHAKDSDEAHLKFEEAKVKINSDPKLNRQDKEKVIEHLKSKVYTSHGTRKEDETAVRTGLDLKRDNNFYTFHIMDLGDKEYVVVGKIDRIEEQPDGSQILVEIKNRTKGLFRRVYDSERVQVQMYLEMLDLQKAKLIEQFNSEINTMEIERDEEYFHEVIHPGLEAFCQSLHSAML
jgi:hypothetical protein